MDKSSHQPSYIQPPSLDPLIILPFDLWIEVLEHALYDNPDFIFVLLFLSRAWQSTILQTPRLWKELVLGNEHDALCKAHLFLALSRDLPVKITIKSKTIEREEFYNLLNEVSHRILELRAEFYYSEVPPSTLSNSSARGFLEKIDKFETLEILVSNGICSYDLSLESTGKPINFTRAPRLRNIDRMPLHLDNISFLERNWVESISCCQSLESLYPFLNSFPRLKTLSIVLCPVARDRFPAPWDQISNFSFPQLESISILYADCPLLNSLMLASGSLLRYLSVTISTSQFSSFISSLSATCSLYSLYIALIGGADLLQVMQAADRVPSLFSLKRFSVIAMFTTREEEEKMAEELLSIFTGKLPKADKITIDIPVPISSIYLKQFLSQCMPLRLTFHCPDLKPSQLRIDLPSIKTLRTNCGSVFGAIEAANLEHLGITTLPSHSFPTTNLRSLVSLTLTFGVSDASQIYHFPVLKRIRWRGTRNSNFFPSFSLPAVNFVGFFGDLLAAKTEAIDDFCDFVLRQPSRFPRLEEIEFPTLPSWDILFLMLLRRNFNENHYSRIKRIHLPLLPAPSILVYLTKLLAGKFIQMPPLLELSPARDLDIYIDPDIPGCLLCLASRQVCLSRVYEASLGPYKFSYEPCSFTAPWEAPIPGGYVRQWVEDRCVREEDNHRRIQDFFDTWFRPSRCDQSFAGGHNHGHILISEDTLSDVRFDIFEIPHLNLSASVK